MANEDGRGLRAHFSPYLLALWGPFKAIFTRLDPVATAASRPEIRAAASSWRDKIAAAPIRKRRPLDTSVVLRERPSFSELDAFEAALAMEFAQAKVYCPHSPLWTPAGMEVWMLLQCAAREAGFIDKVEDFGYLTRMRILPEQVDHEVGKDFTDYGKGNWRSAWRTIRTA